MHVRMREKILNCELFKLTGQTHFTYELASSCMHGSYASEIWHGLEDTVSAAESVAGKTGISPIAQPAPKNTRPTHTCH